jgi:hypothetical protein
MYILKYYHLVSSGTLTNLHFYYMITTIAIILLILWALGFIGFHVLGGFIHILLVIAIILFLLRVIRG